MCGTACARRSSSESAPPLVAMATTNPSTSLDEIPHIVEHLRRAFNAGATKSYEWRMQQLKGVEKMLRLHRDEFAEAVRAMMRMVSVSLCACYVRGHDALTRGGLTGTGGRCPGVCERNQLHKDLGLSKEFAMTLEYDICIKGELDMAMSSLKYVSRGRGGSSGGGGSGDGGGGCPLLDGAIDV